MALPTGLRAFRHADFRRFFVAQLVAQIGSWMQTVAQSWLVLQLTDSPLKLGLIGTLQFGPILLFSIVSGALADRLPKRRLLIVTQTVLGCQALALAALVASGHVQYWHVAVLATGVGLANVLDSPARQSFVAEMVGRSDLSSAVSLNSASSTARASWARASAVS
jgi:MFS family permease